MAKAKSGKPLRAHIRIDGKLESSPRFRGLDAKKQLQEWLKEKQKRKEQIEGGFLSSGSPSFMAYAAGWIRKRMSTHPQATWQADEQRLRTYLLPKLSEFPIDRITRTQMRAILLEAQAEYGLSIATRTRIKALASKIFHDALNEDPPLVTANPCSMLSFQDPRQGKKKPATLEDWDEANGYLRTALEISDLHFLIALFTLMTGARKSEVIPRVWKDVKWKRGVILIDTHVEQVSLSIKSGTKGGNSETREATVPPALLQALLEHRKRSEFKSEADFIFADAKGDWIRPRRFHDIINEIVERYGRPITMHKLRHSYGRLFAASNGNLQMLKALLGHKSMATTQIYAELSNNQVIEAGRGFGAELEIDEKGGRNHAN